MTMTNMHDNQSEFSHPAGQVDEAASAGKCDESSIGSLLENNNVVLFVSKAPKVGLVSEKIQPPASVVDVDDHLRHVETLTAMELRKRYPQEANSHKNMLSRRGSKGALVHPDFVKFANFLRLLGPAPTKNATLDRIDNTDPEYAPGKVRWADKRTQNSNKSDTITIHDAACSKTHSVSRLANLQKVQPGTIRKRKARGWSDAEIVAGVRTVSNSHGEGRFPPGLYSDRQLALLKRSEHQLTSATDVAFHREAHCQANSRVENNEEYFPALYEDLKPDFPELTPEDVERHIARLWPGIRPHVIFHKLKPAEQELLRKIDPQYVAEQSSSSDWREGQS
jgi:hypothetical protein